MEYESRAGDMIGDDLDWPSVASMGGSENDAAVNRAPIALGFSHPSNLPQVYS